MMGGNSAVAGGTANSVTSCGCFESGKRREVQSRLQKGAEEEFHVQNTSVTHSLTPCAVARAKQIL